jgi:hypothetical protein
MSEELTKELLAQSAGIEVLVALVKIDPMKLTPSGRVDYLAALEKQGAWLQSLLQVAIVAVAGSQPSADAGNFSGVDDPQREEIASALNLAPVTAQSRIDVARVLTQHLPATCLALANGEISSAQATVIARESSALLRRGIDPDQLKYLEATAIAYSEFHTPSQVTHKVRSIVAKMAPEEFEVEVAQAAQGRRVIFTPQPYGMAQILALLPAAEAQIIWLAIDKLARVNRDNRDNRDNREEGVANVSVRSESKDLPNFILEQIEPLSLDQLRADALTTIAQRFLAESENQNLAHGRPVTLNLTLDLPTLLGLQENPGILAGYGEIPASVARLLATDAKWKRFISDPISGNLLDFGRLTYQPPQQLVDFIVARDRRCRFPGCRQPARVCDIDHAIPWEEGGQTSKENLGLLCRRHHRMKTHGGWGLTANSDGSCDWVSPKGQGFRVEARRIDELA